jgi:hypothetical protein
MKKPRSEKILTRVNCDRSDRLATMECLVKHLIDNDIAHIWLVLKVLLGIIGTIAGGLILERLKMLTPVINTIGKLAGRL